MAALFANQQGTKRPIFIVVICILSFIMNGFSFCNNLSVFTNPKEETTMLLTEIQQQQQAIPKTTDSVTRDRLINMFTSLASTINNEAIKKLCLASVAAAFICLMGTSLMWRRKKSGIHFFIVGTLVGIVAPFLLFGGNGVSLFIAGIMNFFWLIFVVLFAVNLKYIE
ncbi:MAG TPA: hypothetical protein VK718_11735 [Ferruginibacter sp.]|jgi:hypothetical protein|nr:hypothetical protein [Ferruginibacter sp.]